MAEEKVNATENKEAAPEVIAKSQYDALLAQAQSIINEANARIAVLENDKKVLQDTLNVQNKLVEKLLEPKEK